MPQTLVLIDYDNQRPPQFGVAARAGNPPNLKDHHNAFQAIRRAVVDHLLAGNPETITEVLIRFYGGWSHDLEGNRTDAGAMLGQVISQNRTTRVKHLRVTAELAESLISAPGASLHRTYRQLPWKGDRLVLRSRKPAACTEAASDCQFFDHLRKWALDGRCPKRPACPVEAHECVEQKAQKLIDSMMVADAISGAALQYQIVVVSMDHDLIPGLLAAARFGSPTLLRYGLRNRPGDYDDVLQRQGVQIHDYSHLT